MVLGDKITFEPLIINPTDYEPYTINQSEVYTVLSQKQYLGNFLSIFSNPFFF